jgi:type I restriction-modification system DNA methylase subunit
MRNFLYNKSDILIAVIIIAVAAFVIWTRVDAIMSTGDEAAAAQTTVTQDVPEADDPNATDDEGEATDQDAAETDTPTDEELAAEESAAAEEEAAAEDDTPQEFTVEVGSAASTVAQDLEAAGLVDEAQDFIDELEAQNAVTKLKAGTFKLKPSMSVAQIVKKLT